MEAKFKKILLADDDKDHALLFRKVLQHTYPPAELSITHDGESLIRLLSQESFDLLFLDLNLPCRHGFECLQQIRNDLRLADFPVIVYSSSAQLKDVLTSYANNANLYIVKPFNAAQLANALKQVFMNLDWFYNGSRHKYYFINNQFVPFTAIGS
ncbi:MAG TPA: response regulator [Chitinophagaceae bacterium]